MNKRWVGFVTAVCCYAVGVAVFFWIFDSDILDKFMNWLDDSGIQNRVATLIVICLCFPFTLSLMAGIGFFVIRKWRIFQGWLIGLALTVVFWISTLIYILSHGPWPGAHY